MKNIFRKINKNNVTVIIFIILFTVCTLNVEIFWFINKQYLVIISLFAIILLQSNKISHFSAFGLEVKLKEKIEEADRLIDILKDLVIAAYVKEMKEFLKYIDISNKCNNAGERELVVLEGTKNKIDIRLRELIDNFSNYFNSKELTSNFENTLNIEIVTFIKNNLFYRQLDYLFVSHFGINGYFSYYDHELYSLDNDIFCSNMDDLKECICKDLKEENLDMARKQIDTLIELFNYYKNKIKK